jgi:hypothetical protein
MRLPCSAPFLSCHQAPYTYDRCCIRTVLRTRCGSLTLLRSGSANFSPTLRPTRSSHLPGRTWLGIMLRPGDGRFLTLCFGVEGDRIWCSGVTHQQPQPLAAVAIPTWKKFRESFSLSEPLNCQYFRDRATYKVNDSLQFRVVIKKMPQRDGTINGRISRNFYKVEISQELAPAIRAHAGVISETVREGKLHGLWRFVNGLIYGV